jgi:hypothetical protein
MGVAGWRFANVKRTLRVRAVLVGLLDELPFVCPVAVAIGSAVMIVIKLCKDLPQWGGLSAKARSPFYRPSVLEIEEIGHRHVKADIVIVELRLAASGAKLPFAGIRSGHRTPRLNDSTYTLA